MRNSLIAFAVVAIFCVFCLPLGAQQLEKPRLIIFPFDNQTEVGGEPLGDKVAAALKSNLVRFDKYAPIVFDPQAATIHRAILEGTLAESDSKPPFDEAKALTLAKLLNMDYAIIGTIDSYEIDEERKTAQITLSFQVYDVPKETLKTSSSALGTAKELLLKSQEMILSEATEDATLKAAGEILGVQVQAAPVEVKPVKRNILTILLGFGLFLFLLGK